MVYIYSTRKVLTADSDWRSLTQTADNIPRKTFRQKFRDQYSLAVIQSLCSSSGDDTAVREIRNLDFYWARFFAILQTFLLLIKVYT